jgi:hypothetical protein
VQKVSLPERMLTPRKKERKRVKYGGIECVDSGRADYRGMDFILSGARSEQRQINRVERKN